ncbi:hypothetical protein [Novosphingobium sp. Gsoil 351]|uniref:hypothetical protein n=1 Tax=Novosphingobium sp. Gsoil 351 TaxID=2675225 RepID=UPI0012B46D16|nr:hypothetical protein [Novosphingobium sp. Gsoil 351]QGN55353.1 hypothetical protein GKE62_13155 [Novosphingobium sp. Gsoil 351]
MLKYLTGAAALALAASTALADPGGGKGGGNGGGGNPHQHPGGDGGGKAHGNGGGGGGGGEKAHGNGGGNGHAMRGPDGGNKGNAGGKQQVRATSRGPEDRGNAKAGGPERRAVAVERGNAQNRWERNDGGQDAARERDGRNGGGEWRWASAVPQRTRGLIAGCPPGLAKKGNGCLPPGLARGAVAAPRFYDSPNWWDFDDRWHDRAAWSSGDYRYYDGYLVRYGASGIDSWLPLLGGALAPGNLWPSQYETAALPAYYQDYYGVGQPDNYRYYDDTLYRVEPQSNAITAISALLTGDTFQVGQPIPAGYDVYNVPYSYRDRYVDGPESNYRYSDGTIYQVDPTTQLIKAAIELLT